MKGSVRTALFLTALPAVFAVALASGRMLGLLGTSGATQQAARISGEARRTSPPAAPASAPPTTAAGLMISDSGYTLRPRNTLLQGHGDRLLAFSIEGPDGKTVTRFAGVQGAQLHLLAVSRDLSSYRHLHPTMSPDGTWSAPLELPTAGSYRAFVQFMPVKLNKVLVLGVDLAAGGYFTPKSPPPPTRAVQIGDGDDDHDDLDVSVNGWLHPGQDNDISFTFSRDGLPITDLQPYQGAYAQLAALREGDLAVQIARPGTAGSGPDVGFRLAAPGPGVYRLFLDFRYRDAVKTAAFTMVAQ